MVDGQDVSIEPGQSAFIRRGIVHGFVNKSGDEAIFLSILTPGQLGPEYFQKTADLVKSGRVDPEAMQALMRRHGLVPLPAAPPNPPSSLA